VLHFAPAPDRPAIGQRQRRSLLRLGYLPVGLAGHIGGDHACDPFGRGFAGKAGLGASPVCAHIFSDLCDLVSASAEADHLAGTGLKRLPYLAHAALGPDGGSMHHVTGEEAELHPAARLYPLSLLL